MRFFTTTVAACLVNLPTIAQEQGEARTVQQLYDDCKQEGSGAGTAFFCLGYIGGVADTMNLLEVKPKDGAARNPNAMCAGGRYTYGATRQAFMNWAPKHPELWTKYMLVGVVLALQETWPCGT
jgi:hypothetical protein